MAMGRFDDREFQQFLKQFQSQVEGEVYLKELEKAFRDVTAKTLRIVKKNSPVGEVNGGRLRRSWGAGALRISHGNMEVEIFNNTEYAIYVEMGHRTRGASKLSGKINKLTGGSKWVKGQFFLKKSIEEVESVMSEVMEIAFERALEKMLEG